MSNGIPRDKYEHYESIILSGQMSDSDVIALLRDNPAFDKWYRTRMNVRRDGAAITTAPKGPTKGPWTVDDEDLYVINSCGAMIANCGASLALSRAEKVANANLIAAAPELLEALQGLVRFTDAVRVQVGMGKTQIERLEKARAALAKAVQS